VSRAAIEFVGFVLPSFCARADSCAGRPPVWGSDAGGDAPLAEDEVTGRAGTSPPKSPLSKGGCCNEIGLSAQAVQAQFFTTAATPFSVPA